MKDIEYWNNIHNIYNSFYDGWLDKYFIHFKKNCSFLELGCGKAYNSIYLLKSGFNDVLAGDISDVSLKYCCDKDIENIYLDIKNICFLPSSFDIVIADLCLHYFNLDDTISIFKKISDILTDDGLLIGRVNSINNSFLDDFRLIENNYYNDGDINRRYFEKKDFDLFLDFFDIISLKEVDISKYKSKKTVYEFCLRKK